MARDSGRVFSNLVSQAVSLLRNLPETLNAAAKSSSVHEHSTTAPAALYWRTVTENAGSTVPRFGLNHERIGWNIFSKHSQSTDPPVVRVTDPGVLLSGDPSQGDHNIM